MELTKNGLTEASSNARILLLAENVTENGPAAVKIKWQFTFLYLVSLGTVWGNVFVCLAVYLERKLRNRFNLFLVSLAISDMLCAVLVMPISAWRMIYGLPERRDICLLWYSLDIFFTATTIIHLCSISLDRYLALRQPLGRARRRYCFRCTCHSSILKSMCSRGSGGNTRLDGCPAPRRWRVLSCQPRTSPSAVSYSYSSYTLAKPSVTSQGLLPGHATSKCSCICCCCRRHRSSNRCFNGCGSGCDCISWHALSARIALAWLISFSIAGPFFLIAVLMSDEASLSGMTLASGLSKAINSTANSSMNTMFDSSSLINTSISNLPDMLLGQMNISHVASGHQYSSKQINQGNKYSEWRKSTTERTVISTQDQVDEIRNEMIYSMNKLEKSTIDSQTSQSNDDSAKYVNPAVSGPAASYKGCGPNSPSFVLTAAGVTFLLPLTIMTTTYILTIRSLVRQMQQAKAAQLYPNNAIATTPLITATSSSSGPTSRKSSTLSVINLASGTGITVSPVVKKLKRCGSAIEASHGTMTIGQTSHPATGTQVLFRTHGKKLGSKAGLTTRPSLQVVIQVETGLLDMKAPGHSDVEGCLDRGQRLKRQMRSSLQPWIGLWPRLSITGVRHGRSDIGIPKSKASICEQRRTMANLTVPGSLTYSPTSEESSDWPTWRKRSTASVLSFAQQGQQQQPQRSALERIHRGQRAVQVIGVLFGVFLACYLPFFFVYLLDTLCEACQWWTRPAIPHTEWLGYLGSMLNPFVYHFFNPTFRRTFRRMMHCECRRRPAEYQAIWSAKAHQ